MVSTALLAALLANTAGLEHGVQPAARLQPHVRVCGTDSPMRGGGMINNGWDGPGKNSVTLYWHIESYSPDIPVVQQRAAFVDALMAWAGVAQIHFVEIGAPNRTRSFDLRFTTGDHCAIEGAECGDADCAFDGSGGVLAHAGFPPGANSACGGIITESFAGNVHFDEAERWEQDDFFGFDFSLTLIAAHEIGHSLGLVHDEDLTGGPHIMRPTFSSTDGMQAPSASDTAHLRSGYASGVGSVTTLEDSGIWVNGTWLGFEAGIPGEPFNSVAEGVGAVPPDTDGITVHVLGGIYPENITISRPCTITSEFGSAFIGQ